MTYSQIYKHGAEKLRQNNVENFNFDNRIIFENIFGLDRVQLAIKGEQSAPKDEINNFLKCIDERINGKPLQYIIGVWEFMGLDFFVGDGVLIPREETEILVKEVQKELQNSRSEKIIFDLCSGSGCIGISIAKLCKNCKVYLIEKSPIAIKYLEKNIKQYGLQNVVAINSDITKGFEFFDLPNPDIIISNPPYIKSDEIKELQKEVQKEPIMALDGGDDGLYFYKILAEKWAPYLCEKGMIAVEIGDEQEKDVCDIFSKVYSNIETKQDFNEINRVVIARK
ncbi:MAG: peptide chain release factor N(5)-glutamine methyltransferase [Acutalibacteraceae bacterium]|jgi:release factor glutamine methyltransferase